MNLKCSLKNAFLSVRPHNHHRLLSIIYYDWIDIKDYDHYLIMVGALKYLGFYTVFYHNIYH